MKRITCVYPGAGGNLYAAIEKQFGGLDDKVEFIHIQGSGILQEVIDGRGMTEHARERLLHVFDGAAATKPDIVVCTCSSIGEVAEEADKLHPEVKILRIDEAMAREAVSKYTKIGVMATLFTTVPPSCRLVERIAREEGKDVTVINATADAAFAAQMEGKGDVALAEMKKTAKQLYDEGAQIILLAQASMAPHCAALQEMLGIPVLASPAECEKQLRKLLA